MYKLFDQDSNADMAETIDKEAVENYSFVWTAEMQRRLE